MSEIRMTEIGFDKPTVCIICLGPATPNTGMSRAEHLQVVIDPAQVTKDGAFIQFMGPTDQLRGWFRTDAITVCHVLGDAPKSAIAEAHPMLGVESVSLMAVTEE